MKNEVPDTKVAKTFCSYMYIATQLEQYTQIENTDLILAVLELTEKETYQDLSLFKNLVASEIEYQYLNVYQLAETLTRLSDGEVTSSDATRLLVICGLVYSDGSNLPTLTGAPFCKRINCDTPFLVWQSKVISKLLACKQYFDAKKEGDN